MNKEDLVSEYRYNWAKRILLGVLIPPFSFGMIAIGFRIPEAFGIPAVFGVAALVWLVRSFVAGRRLRILLFQDRLERHDGPRVTTVRFDPELKIFHSGVAIAAGTGGPALGTYQAVLLVSGSFQIRLDGEIRNFAELQEQLSEVESNFVYPETVARYQASERLEFGPASLQDGQIIAGNKRASIVNLTSPQIRGGILRLKTKDGKVKFAFPVQKIANLSTFTAILQTAH